MSRRTKWGIAVGSVVLVLASLVLIFTLLGKNNTLSSDSPYELEVVFKDPEHLYEVRIYEEGTYLYIDEERDSLLSLIPTKVNPLLMLPEVSGSYDVRLEKEESDFTWNCSLENSAKFLNYLEEQGYRYIIEGHTSQFIEKYLYKDSKILRVLIFSKQIMVGELNEGAKLPQVKDYIKYDIGRD